jgi:hypothetical protein
MCLGNTNFNNVLIREQELILRRLPVSLAE